VPEPFALSDVTIVAGDPDGTVLPDRTVVVGPNGKIEQVGPSADTVAPVGYKVLDLTGRFVVPGLINAHAHLFSNGLPLPKILLKESTAGIVARLGRGPIGRRLFRSAQRPMC
jgi:imidazolonepropionase-like amidohydrolase